MDSLLKSIWKESQRTLGKSRYHKDLDCWLFASADDIPDYMQIEWERGRILLCIQFTDKGPPAAACMASNIGGIPAIHKPIG